MSKHERSQSQDDVLRHPHPKRAKEIDQHTPFQELSELLKKQKSDPKPRNVLHWFRSKDLRQEDNHALSAASSKAKEGSGSLISMYLFTPSDMEWHGTSPARCDFILQTLQLLKDDLAKKNIPLAISTAEERAQKVDTVLDFVKKHNVSHIYCNFEYEVDELRRDIKLAKRLQNEKDISLTILHDQTVVEPGSVTTGSGGPHKVFTPYHKVWCEELKSNPKLVDLYPSPEGNDKPATSSLKDLFSSEVPSLPKSKQFPSPDDQKRIRGLWPPGHAAGHDRLMHFLKEKSPAYATTRSDPSKDSSSRMSAYFSAGIVSVREAISAAAKHNSKADTDFRQDGPGDPGVASWVREIVFREFYRQVMVMSPHTSMNLPQNMKFDYVEWEKDEEGWEKWYEGKTGYPLVDAGMRQLNHEAYMHNRARMTTASFLRMNLLIDYRRGERYFAETLVDWDLSNNTQGWEPSHTCFNPVSQAERNDPSGDYIRQWIPELRSVKGKAVFDPHARLSKAEFEKLGYPAPHVDFAETKARATERYKMGFQDADI